MFTRNIDRRIVRGLAGSLGLLAVAANAIAFPVVNLSFSIRPIEADFTGEDGSWLVTDAGQPGVAGTGGVYISVTDTEGDAAQVWSHAPPSGPGALKDPSAAEALGNGEVAIADMGNHRVLIVNQAGQITWNSANVQFSDGRLLRGPSDVQILSDGTPSMADNPILIACKDNNRVVAVRRTGQVLWAMNAGLSAPLKAERLADGSTLILDAGNGQLLRYMPGQPEPVHVWNYPDALTGATDVDAIEQEGGGYQLLITTPAGFVTHAPND